MYGLYTHEKNSTTLKILPVSLAHILFNQIDKAAFIVDTTFHGREVFWQRRISKTNLLEISEYF